MTANVEIKYNFKELEKLTASLSKKLYTKVGILGDKKSRDDEITNSEIGIIHEFGSVANNIPARSFLRMPIQEKRKDIVKEVQKMKKQIEKNPESIYLYLGIAAEGVIQDAFSSQGFGKWQALKHRKGSPLIDTGQLRRSITSVVAKG